MSPNHSQHSMLTSEHSVIPLPRRRLRSPDFDNLGFDVYDTAKMYLSCHLTSEGTDESHQWPYRCFEIGYEKYYSDGYEDTSWQRVTPESLVPFQNLSLHPAACALHYSVSAFEGTKAFISAKGKVALFRPETNGRRLQRTAARLLLPKVPVSMFVESVTETVLANREFIPPYRAENWAWETRNPRFLYVRPLLMGYGPQIGVRPSTDHLYLVYVTPVRAYYPVEGLRVLVSRGIHRAAPGGIGSAKAAANYVSGIIATQLARRGCEWVEGKSVKVSDQPFSDVLYLDAVHNQYIEEFSGANFLAVTTEGTLVSPESDSVLPGITRDSALTLAAEVLGIKVERRPLSIAEVMDPNRITEAFCTGNAAVVTPIVSIYHAGKTRTFQPRKVELARRLWDLLVGIQLQTREDPFGWVKEIG